MSDVTIKCAVCQKSELLLALDIEDLLTNEKLWNVLASMLPKWGWTVARDQKIGRYGMCSECAAKLHEQQTMALTPFVEDESCPKCGQPHSVIHYCDGKTNCWANVQREHLHRKCGRCGYEWLVAPADQSKRYSQRFSVREIPAEIERRVAVR